MRITLIFSHQPTLLYPKRCCPQLHCLNKLHREQAKAAAQETADVTSETHSPVLLPSVFAFIPRALPVIAFGLLAILVTMLDLPSPCSHQVLNRNIFNKSSMTNQWILSSWEAQAPAASLLSLPRFITIKKSVQPQSITWLYSEDKDLPSKGRSKTEMVGKLCMINSPRNQMTPVNIFWDC